MTDKNKKLALKSTLEELKNVDKPLPKQADIFNQIREETSEVVRASLRDWQSAYEEAKDRQNPLRISLLEIFETIEIDTHVSAVAETIFWGIASMDFKVTNENNEDDDEKSNLFKTKWFQSWLAITAEAIFWGFSGIQYGPIEDDKYKWIKSIPRYNILPEKNGIVENEGQDKIDISFEDEPYKSWTTLVFPRMFGDQYQLGKYNKVAKWFILKREVTQFWAIYNEIFGHPYRVTKTDTADKVRRQNAINAMEAMTSASFAVVDLNDEVDFVTASTGAGYKTFDDFISTADKQISKALVGSTMVVDEGSSRSQSETHETNTNAFIVGYARAIQYLINDELIPKMVKHGFPITTDDKFVYEHIEKLTKKEWAEIINILSTSYDIPTDFITEQLGVPVEEKIIQLPTATNVEGLENKSLVASILSNMYKNFTKGWQ